METIHEVNYLIQTDDGLFLSQPHISTIYTDDPLLAQCIKDFDTAKEMANYINYLSGKNKDLLPPRRVRIVRHDIYHTFTEEMTPLTHFPSVKN